MVPFSLRPLSPDDLDALVALDQDPEVMRYINGGTPTPRALCSDVLLPRMLAQATAPGLGFFAVEASGGAFLGWRPSPSSTMGSSPGSTWVRRRYRTDARLPDNDEAVEPEYVLTSMWYDPEEYFGVGTTTQDDQYGRLWLLVDVDLVAAEEKIGEYDALVEELWGAEKVGENPGIEYTENPGEIQEIDLQSWTFTECDAGDPGPELYEHSNDDLDIISSTYNERQRKIVVVWLDFGTTTGQCSGTLVDNNTVLTAGHCIADEVGYILPAADITVCSYGNVQSRGGVHQRVGPRDPGAGLDHSGAGRADL